MTDTFSEYDRARKRDWIRQFRKRNAASGLTCNGTPRKRAHREKVTGLTLEQKRERRKAQQRAWRRKDYARNKK